MGNFKQAVLEFSQQFYEVSNILIFRVRNLCPREVTSLAFGHMDNKWQSKPKEHNFFFFFQGLRFFMSRRDSAFSGAGERKEMVRTIGNLQVLTL